MVALFYVTYFIFILNIMKVIIFTKYTCHLHYLKDTLLTNTKFNSWNKFKINIFYFNKRTMKPMPLWMHSFQKFILLKQISNTSISIEQPLDLGFFGVFTGFSKVPGFKHDHAWLMALALLKYLLKIKKNEN